MARTKGIKNKNELHKYTEEELEFLRMNYPNWSLKELTEMFNKKFSCNINFKSLASTLHRRGIKSGRTGQFIKGQQPFNKDLKWDDYMSKESQEKSKKTCFSKEDRSINNSNHNELPIGTEVVTKDGYILVKVSEPKGTKAHRFLVEKHKLTYEQHYGSIPKGYKVIFADGNKRNFDIDNLILVSDNELLQINKHNLYYKGCADATKCGVLIAKIKIKQSEVKKNGN